MAATGTGIDITFLSYRLNFLTVLFSKWTKLFPLVNCETCSRFSSPSELPDSSTPLPVHRHTKKYELKFNFQPSSLQQIRAAAAAAAANGQDSVFN